MNNNLDILDRQPPFNLDAEKQVLGSILLLPENCDEVELVLQPADFYDDANRRLYEHLLGMWRDSARIDIPLLAERLKSAGDFELIGGASYLAQVSNSVATPAHAIYYGKIVRSKSTHRALIEASIKTAQAAYDESTDADELLAEAETRLMEIGDRKLETRAVRVNEVAQEALDNIDRRASGRDDGSVRTGWVDLDAILSGLLPGQLVIVAARPSMGKSSLCQNIAMSASFRDEISTLFVSLEMSRSELGDRLLSSAASVDSYRIRRGRLDDVHKTKVMGAARDYSQSPLFVLDAATIGVEQIAAHARRMKRKHRLGLLVIDYLQLIAPSNEKDSRVEQVSKVSRSLKKLASQLQLPVVCAAQLSRAADGVKPKLGHLRESGSIEQDADVVIFIHRDKMTDVKTEITVAKNRTGPTDVCTLRWSKEFTRFDNLSGQEPERMF